MRSRRYQAAVAGGMVIGGLLVAVAQPAVADMGRPCDFDGDGRSDLAVGALGDDVGESNAGSVAVFDGAPGLLSARGALFHQGVSGVPDDNEDSDLFGSSLACGDFDRDGFDDLAVGAPLEDFDGLGDAGAVTVLYGSATGLSGARAQQWTQDSPRIAGIAQDGDLFGSTLAAGDFDGDGRDDLAIGAPQEDVRGQGDAGTVHVIYGSAVGLRARGDQVFAQSSPGVRGGSEEGDQFGASLTAGDFNGDGRTDLAVGVPFEDVGPRENIGAVNVLYGTRAGLTGTGSQVWTRGSRGVVGKVAAFDSFAWNMASGDLDGDGRDDLVVGVPFDDVNGVSDAGSVSVLYGSTRGIAAARSQFWAQDSPGIPGSGGIGVWFGFGLTTGDFDGDGRDDLAVGTPWDDLGAGFDQGSAHVIRGGAAGLTAAGAQSWTLGSAGGIAGEADLFGLSLAAGDFDGDGRDDLAIGAPFADIGAAANAGLFRALRGGAGGLSAAGSQQRTLGDAGTADTQDLFGAWDISPLAI